MENDLNSLQSEFDSMPTFESEQVPSAASQAAFSTKVTDVDALESLEDSADPMANKKPEEKSANEEDKPQDEKTEDQVPQIEYTANGKKYSAPVPTNEQIAKLMAKVHGSSQKLEEAARQLAAAKEERRLIEQTKTEKSRPVEIDRAVSLAEKGHTREALLELINVLPGADQMLQAFIEDELDYRKATPENRLIKDSERKSRAEEIRRLRAEDELKSHKADLQAEADRIQRETYKGHIQDSLSRYDLSQWIDDTAVSKEFNGLLRDAALQQIAREQRSREAKGLEDLNGTEIRAIVAKNAKMLKTNYDRTQQARKEASSQSAAERMKSDNGGKPSTPQQQAAKPGDKWAEAQKRMKEGASLSDLTSFLFRK